MPIPIFICLCGILLFIGALRLYLINKKDIQSAKIYSLTCYIGFTIWFGALLYIFYDYAIFSFDLIDVLIVFCCFAISAVLILQPAWGKKGKRGKRILELISLVFVILIIALSVNIFSLKNQNNTFQFKQERIDQQFSITLSLLCTELFDKQPADEITIIELKSQLELLLPLTTYLEIEDMDKIVKILISVAESPTELSSNFTSDLIERIEYFVSNLGRPLPDDIDTQSKSIYSDLSLLSIGA